jgi:sRNA-binding regulator protein Hfq
MRKLNSFFSGINFIPGVCINKLRVEKAPITAYLSNGRYLRNRQFSKNVFKIFNRKV